MNMKTQRIIGLVMIVLGVIMFFIGASLFSYTGELNPIINEIGKYSFFCWLPTILVGVLLFTLKKSK